MADPVQLGGQASTANETWTPVIVCDAPEVTVTHTAQVGSAFKMGGLLLAYFRVAANLSGVDDADPGAGISIVGLPYEISADAINTVTGEIGDCTGILLGSNTDLKLYGGAGTAILSVYLFPASQGVSLAALDPGAGGDVAINGFVIYPTDG